MSKARQSKRQRYRKPRADYQAGGRVNVRIGGGGPGRFTEYDAVMPRGGKKISKKKTDLPLKDVPIVGDQRYTPVESSGDVKSELDKKTRIIGVCLGAQLLANAAGGDVEILKYGSPPKPIPEIGWSQVFFNQTQAGGAAIRS